jgi:hypothetical protein
MPNIWDELSVGDDVRAVRRVEKDVPDHPEGLDERVVASVLLPRDVAGSQLIGEHIDVDAGPPVDVVVQDLWCGGVALFELVECRDLGCSELRERRSPLGRIVAVFAGGSTPILSYPFVAHEAVRLGGEGPQSLHAGRP